ncbi:MAG: hypothetical protein KJ927_05245, partial [Candidatus Eisenbacteria bacterium]|nr:hypothetical protein [Candidatus Eisenbacteria bacterium]
SRSWDSAVPLRRAVTALKQRLRKEFLCPKNRVRYIGLELLSTIHWVICKEHATTPEEVVRRTYDWNDRKRQFTERQIALAVDRLARMGWIGSSSN